MHHRCSDSDGVVRRALARPAGVVAEDEPAAALATGIHDRPLTRTRELLEHLGANTLVLGTELGITQPLLNHPLVKVPRDRSDSCCPCLPRVPGERRPYA